MLTTAPHYGVADPVEARLMSGRAFLEAIMDGRLPAPPIARTLSFTLAEVGDGFAVFEGDAGEHLLNPLGVVHGGWALTLIDSATGCAAQTILPAGVSYTTIETKANFDRPILKDIRAGARRGAGHQPRPAHHLLRRSDHRRAGAHPRPRRLDADGFAGRRLRRRVKRTEPANFSRDIFLRELESAACGEQREDGFFCCKPLKSPDSDK